MNDTKIKLLLEAFGLKVSVSEWKPFGHGHINDTYLIKTSGDYAPDYILQRKNHLIFKNIAGMMNNIMLATGHIRTKLILDGEDEIDRKVMTYLPAVDQKFYVLDEESNYWTICLYIRGSHGIEEVTNGNQAYSAGKAFGHFQFQLADLQGSKLIETIPNFHNGKFRYKQLLQAIDDNLADRLESIKKETDALLARADEMTRLQDWLDNGELPLRTTHNDTKINNVLYDDQDNILCIIDLDTVMPGYVHYDFGDAIRTVTNTAAEDEIELSKVNMDIDLFRAYARGYLSETGKTLNQVEKEYLAFAPKLITYTIGIRFLTDFIDGDNYFKIHHELHNLQRSRAQLKLVMSMEEQYGEMQKIIGELV